MMSENNKIGTYKFVAEPFHVDFTGRLTMGVLGNHLLNCAGFHASDRGFGIATLNEDNYTWVLSRLAVELDEMPYQYEDFSIQTWVENVYRLFTDRNFAIIDKEGKKIGYARSVWAMISMNTRKPADLLALHSGSIVDYVCDEPCPIEKPSRIKVASKEPVAALVAKYSDIDINGHVNSIRYIEHILDLFHVRTGREIVGNNLIGIHVKNRRNVAFTPRQIELRYICCPLLKRLLGTEIPIDNVISDLAHIAFVGMVLFLGAFAA